MNIYKIMEAAAVLANASRVFESNQLTLGALIKKLEGFGNTYGEEDKDKLVYFDFGTARPTTLHSWRGSYSELALGYELAGYDDSSSKYDENTMSKLLVELKSGVGKVFQGWKGGDFRMGNNTPMWVSNPGNGSHTALVDAIDDVFRVILITKWIEY